MALTIAFAPGVAVAKGCITGAIAGGVVGHWSGHGTFTGAVAACITGHKAHKLAGQGEIGKGPDAIRLGARPKKERGFGLASVTARSSERAALVSWTLSSVALSLREWQRNISTKKNHSGRRSHLLVDQKRKTQDDYTALWNAAMLCRVE
jgi:hypothetical protein